MVFHGKCKQYCMVLQARGARSRRTLQLRTEEQCVYQGWMLPSFFIAKSFIQIVQISVCTRKAIQQKITGVWEQAHLADKCT